MRPNGRGVAITAHGSRVIAAAGHLVDAHDTAVERLTATDAPVTVRVLTNEVITTNAIAELTAHMRRTHPHVSLEWTTDPTLLLQSSDGPGHDLVVCQVLESDVAPDDRICWVDQMHWIQGLHDDLNEDEPLPLVAYGPTCFYRTYALQTLDNAGWPHRIAVVCSTFGSVNDAVRAGLGIGIVNTRNRQPGTRPWPQATALPHPPHVAQICRLAPDAPPPAHYLADLLAASP